MEFLMYSVDKPQTKRAKLGETYALYPVMQLYIFLVNLSVCETFK